MKIIVIGGVAGGASSAARLRRLDETSQIIMFERDQYISFANCGLPYHIGEVIKDKSNLVVQTPEKMREKLNIDVRINTEVKKINRQDKTVTVYDKAHDKEYTESYDKLVLSPGATPFKPDIDGLKSNKIFTLRNIPDTLSIKKYVDTKEPKRALVVGAGFIGLEVAENLHHRGVKVTVVELADHVIGPLDFEMAAIVHQHLKSKDVEFYLKDAVVAFEDKGEYLIAKLKSGKELKVDMAMLGIGVKPENKLAVDAGLEVGPRGAIVVDKYLKTSDDDIYAVGDAIEVFDKVNGTKTQIPLAGPANRQGRMVANNIYGQNEEYLGTQGTSIVKVFDVAVATTGNNEKTLQRIGIDYEKSFTHSASHAGYYPGAIPMSIKLLFRKPDGLILGAQIIGYEGVDKRIDVIATAIHAKMTTHDLEKLELAYAPPFSSAKDPVNIAGYVASNILKGDLKVIHWNQVKDIDTSKDMLIDVRSQMEYDLHHLDGAVNIPIEEMRKRLNEIPKEGNVYLYCNTGLNAYLAYRILALNGYENVKNISGSLKTYDMTTQTQSNEDIYEYDKILKDDEIVRVGGNNIDIPSDSDLEVDACGLQCPGPIMQVYQNINTMDFGQVLHITASDPGFEKDVKVWCESTGNRLMGLSFKENKFHAYIKKQKTDDVKAVGTTEHDKTMIVFSGDLDKAIASFIIANGAAAMGRNVTMFFTFWGLNILRKPEKVKVKKDLLSKMFAFMMPKGSKKLKLSQMSMGGIGGKLIRHLMKSNNVDSLETLIEQAKRNGVKIIACNMSMDLMGITREELMEGIEYGGVASYLGAAEHADTNLFIS